MRPSPRTSRLLMLLGSIFITTNSLDCAAKVFDLRVLPRGKNVTLLAPATTNIPLAESVELAPTDLPQTISLKSISTKGRPVTYRVSIGHPPNLQQVTIAPGKTALYPFTKLDKVQIQWEIEGRPATLSSSTYFLQISSTRPLTVGR